MVTLDLVHMHSIHNTANDVAGLCLQTSCSYECNAPRVLHDSASLGQVVGVQLVLNQTVVASTYHNYAMSCIEKFGKVRELREPESCTSQLQEGQL